MDIQKPPMTQEQVMDAMNRVPDEVWHANEADRLTELAKSDDPEMGSNERTRYLTEANNHLLRLLLSRLTVERVIGPLT